MIERVLFEDDADQLSIEHVLGWVVFQGSTGFGYWTLRFSPGTRCVRVFMGDGSVPVDFYRGPALGGHFLRVIRRPRDGVLVGEVVERDDIEFETDDVPDEFYE